MKCCHRIYDRHYHRHRRECQFLRAYQVIYVKLLTLPLTDKLYNEVIVVFHWRAVTLISGYNSSSALRRPYVYPTHHVLSFAQGDVDDTLPQGVQHRDGHGDAVLGRLHRSRNSRLPARYRVHRLGVQGYHRAAAS